MRSPMRSKLRWFSTVSVSTRICLAESGTQNVLVTSLAACHRGGKVYVLNVEVHPPGLYRIVELCVMP